MKEILLAQLSTGPKEQYEATPVLADWLAAKWLRFALMLPTRDFPRCSR